MFLNSQYVLLRQIRSRLAFLMLPKEKVSKGIGLSLKMDDICLPATLITHAVQTFSGQKQEVSLRQGPRSSNSIFRPAASFLIFVNIRLYSLNRSGLLKSASILSGWSMIKVKLLATT